MTHPTTLPTPDIHLEIPGGTALPIRGLLWREWLIHIRRIFVLVLVKHRLPSIFDRFVQNA